MLGHVWAAGLGRGASCAGRVTAAGVVVFRLTVPPRPARAVQGAVRSPSGRCVDVDRRGAGGRPMQAAGHAACQHRYDAVQRATSVPPVSGQAMCVLGESPRATGQRVPPRKGRTSVCWWRRAPCPSRGRGTAALPRSSGAARHGYSYVASAPAGWCSGTWSAMHANTTGLTLALTSPPSCSCSLGEAERAPWAGGGGRGGDPSVVCCCILPRDGGIVGQETQVRPGVGTCRDPCALVVLACRWE